MSPRILLIESDLYLAAIYLRRLRAAAFEVIHAAHGEEGWRLIREEKPDVIMMELILPRKDGYEILEDKQNMPEVADIPTIILTKLGTSEDVKRCQDYGVQQYFIKHHHGVDEVIRSIHGACQPEAVY
jgi:DNA-binding response OmpR family regulator